MTTLICIEINFVYNTYLLEFVEGGGAWNLPTCMNAHRWQFVRCIHDSKNAVRMHAIFSPRQFATLGKIDEWGYVGFLR